MLNMFRKPKPKGYNYRPIYYDADKEQRTERQRVMEGATDEDAIKYRLRQGFKRGYSEESARSRRQATIRSNMRLFLIIVLLFVVAYIILAGNMSSLLKFLG